MTLPPPPPAAPKVWKKNKEDQLSGWVSAFCAFASGGNRGKDVSCHAGRQNDVFGSVKNSIPSKKEPVWLQSLQWRI